MGCCGECKCCKITLCIMVALQGLIFMILCALIVKNDTMFNSTPVVGISMGGGGVTIAVFVMITAGVGLYGAIKDNKWFLYGYCAALLIFGLTTLGLGTKAMSFYFSDDSEKIVNKQLAVLFISTNKEDKERVDRIQNYFNCQGLSGSTLVESIKSKPKRRGSAPDHDYDNFAKTDRNLFQFDGSDNFGECGTPVKIKLYLRTAGFLALSWLYGIFWTITALVTLCCVLCRSNTN